MVDGTALGWGCTQLYLSDFMCVFEKVTSQTPFTQVGIVPGDGSSFTSAKLTGKQPALFSCRRTESRSIKCVQYLGTSYQGNRGIKPNRISRNGVSIGEERWRQYNEQNLRRKEALVNQQRANTYLKDMYLSESDGKPESEV